MHHPYAFRLRAPKSTTVYKYNASSRLTGAETDSSTTNANNGPPLMCVNSWHDLNKSKDMDKYTGDGVIE